MKIRKKITVFICSMILCTGSIGIVPQAVYAEETTTKETDKSQEIIWNQEGAVFLKSNNGEVWKLLPEKEKVADNVKKIEYRPNIWDGESSSYTESWFVLRKDGSLWRNNEKIKDNVEKFTISGDNEQYYLEILTYNDELWESEKLVGGTDKTQLTKTDDHVKDIPTESELSGEYLYLAGNGDLKSYPRLKEKWGTEKIFDSNVMGFYDKEVVRINDYQTSLWRFGYYDTNNALGYFDRSDSTTKKLNIKDRKIESIGIRSFEQGNGEIFDEVFLFTEDHQLWKETVKEGSKSVYVKIAENVHECFWESETYQTTDGTYYTLDGEKMKSPSSESPITLYKEEDLSNGDVYEILNIGSEEGYILQKNGKTIFTGLAKDELSLYRDGKNSFPIVVCKDNTIWKVSDTPEKLFDFNEGKTGDIDGDGKVGMKDARLALKAAVGSEQLTDGQKKFADVDKDGKVGMKDARLILKYAVGSIEEF